MTYGLVVAIIVCFTGRAKADMSRAAMSGEDAPSTSKRTCLHSHMGRGFLFKVKQH